ncbi:MAG: lipopolysaccharide transport periplasmic protein LptA [Panacagrimonas sp.]
MSRAHKLLSRAFSVLMATGVPLALAQNSASPRPTGPITIEADHADWSKGGAMVYVGNVRLLSGDLKLAGSRMEFRQASDGQFEARIDGGPATLNHAGLPTEDGKPGPPVSARGETMTYDSRAATVEIDGAATLARGTDEIKGGNIRYDVTNRRIQANGGEGGQVRIVIQPPPPDADKKPSPPSPSP